MRNQHSGSSSRLKPAAFFDRDGTLNVDTHYPHKPSDMVLIPGAAAAVRRFQDAGFYIIIVTNQSGIARGYFDEDDMRAFNSRLISALNDEGARVDLILHCPHHPDFTGPCECRKPATGLIDQAFALLPIERKNSLLIGDNMRDIQCAASAGIRGYLFDQTRLDDFCNRIAFSA